MASEISAGQFFPVPRILHDDKNPQEAAAKHRELLAQALNEVASAAFMFEVMKDTSNSAQAATGSFADYPLQLSVYTPVPAYAILVAQLRYEMTTAGTGQFLMQFTENGSAMDSRSLRHNHGFGTGEPDTMTLIDASLSLEAQTLYDYRVQIRSTGTAVFSANNGTNTADARLITFVFPRSVV